MSCLDRFSILRVTNVIHDPFQDVDRLGLAISQFGPDFLGGNMSLTKDKLITRLQTQVGMDKQESRQIVERLLGIMKDTLTQGEELLISGFGKFSVRQKNARRGRNPQTEETLILGARKVLVFKSSRVLRNRINESS